MKIKTRILLGTLVIFTASFYFILDFMINEIRPRYMETVEESMNDTAHILAALIEEELDSGTIRADKLRRVFTRAFKRKIYARIYGVRKDSVDMNMYVTGSNGTVIYDSDNGRREGMDFSRWNDVHLTLEGGYGARTTRSDPNDPSTASLYVAAPIKYGDSIIGVCTVIKPENSVGIFMELARRKIIIAGIITCAIFIFLSTALSFWITRPILLLTEHVKKLKTHRRAALPGLGKNEMGELGRAFEEMRIELEGKQYIENYIQTLTHELKSPLSSIIASAELLTEDIPEEQRKKFNLSILEESHRIRSLIERLLELSSLENRRELRNPVNISMEKLLEDIIRSLSPQASMRSVKLELQLSENCTVHGEEFLIRHTVLNLLHNAVDFSPEGGSVEISMKSENSRCTVSVKDKGPGIPAFALDKIYDKFYSLPAKRGRIKSTGLGLSFASEAVTLHGGTISVINNHGPGVTASISVPSLPA